MLQHIKKSIILLTITLFSCEAEDSLNDVINQTWDLDWKKCGPYHNQFDAVLLFNLTDSTSDGWFLEQGFDTVYFEASILSNEAIYIEKATDGGWNGELKVHDFGLNRLDVERKNVGCENEMFRFK
ncbi:MAG: hypothetical protein ACI9U0_001489 [Flavobacteriales bacterium]|jgi:hypothetical protein|tara:strand:- start:6125 stop:6502 length:378 start_codon:yes stop_codon:yes gene_type:complete